MRNTYDILPDWPAIAPKPGSDPEHWMPLKESIGTRPIGLRSQGRATVFTSAGDRRMTTESYLEATVRTVVLSRRDIAQLQEQPAAIRYVDLEGRDREHTFDFLATLSNASRVAISVKPSKKVSHRFRAELRNIAGQVSRDFAEGVVLVTERAVPPDILSNSQMICSVRADRDYDTYARLVEFVRTLRGAASIGDIGQTLKRSTSCFRAVVRLIAAGFLVPLTSEPFVPTTLVRAARMVEIRRAPS